MILVVGGTGNLGQPVVLQLLAEGKAVRVMTREPLRASKLQAAGAQVVKGDLRDAQSLKQATQGARIVVSSSHALLSGRANSSRLVDDTGQHALIHAAEQAGVEQFVFVSALGASPSHPIDFWRTKARIEEFLRTRPLRFTIIRPSAFIGLHAYDLIGKPVVTGKPVIMFGAGTQLINYVAESDVATLLISAIDNSAMDGQTIEIGGPDNLSAHQIVQIFEKLSGRTARVVHVPLLIPRVLSGLIQPMHEGIGRLLKASANLPKQDMTFDPRELLSRYPRTLTRLEDWAHDRVARQNLEDRPSQ